MRKITPHLTSELYNEIDNGAGIDVVASEAYRVNKFSDLVLHVAKLANLNSDYIFLYRGQHRDYKNKAGRTTLYPTIYRGEPLQRNEIRTRFDVLNDASTQLIDSFKVSFKNCPKVIRRNKYIQWSILQHYNSCTTPLLDFTQSLRVACSFAVLDNNSAVGYVYICAFPYITNRISINSEYEIVNIRLLSISPPEALRPHFQEGYLAGTTDILFDYDDKSEMDFNRRLIAKFQIPTKKSFWGKESAPLPKSLLFPDEEDRVYALLQQIKKFARGMAEPGKIGDFIREWVNLEEFILSSSRTSSDRIFPINRAIHHLVDIGRINENDAIKIDQLRKFRNILVHQPKKIEMQELDNMFNILIELLETLNPP